MAEIEMFFDGECPLCMREVAMLRRRDRKGRVRFTDIAAPSFDAEAHGKDQATFMGRIQARTLPDGEWLDGVEVFRRVYAAVGFRWLVPLTRVPGISHALEAGYSWFARNRLRLTRRQDEACTDRCAPRAAVAEG